MYFRKKTIKYWSLGLKTQNHVALAEFYVDYIGFPVYNNYCNCSFNIYKIIIDHKIIYLNNNM